MTNIGFYVVNNNTLHGRLLLACHLVEKARAHNMFVHIHTDGFNSSRKMDELLWTWRETSFIPHTLNLSDHQHEAVTISAAEAPTTRCDYLINLSNQRPPFFKQYKKMAEILDQTETILAAGRERYLFYKQKGYTLSYYQL